jgi:hypothetical protein
LTGMSNGGWRYFGREGLPKPTPRAQHQGRDGRDQHRLGDTGRPVAADIAGDLEENDSVTPRYHLRQSTRTPGPIVQNLEVSWGPIGSVADAEHKEKQNDSGRYPKQP